MPAISCSYYDTQYCCGIVKQKIPPGPIFVKGVHTVGRSNRSVKELHIVNCEMPVFPTNLQHVFPALEFLWITNCTLQSIGRDHIGNWKALRNVYIQGCKELKSLRGDTFRDLRELEQISLDNNQLEDIGPDIFDDLEKLSYVDLRGNVTINMDAHRSELGKIRKEIEEKCKARSVFGMLNLSAAKALAKDESTRKLLTEVEEDNRKLMAELEEKNSKFIAELVNQKKSQRCQVKAVAGNDGKIIDKLKPILADEAFKDFTINIGESSFKVHKLIFAAHSQTLAELFRNNPQAEVLNFCDIPVPTFKAVYDFIYTDQLPIDVNYFEVFAAAARLKIDDLKETAAAHLIKNIDESNSYEVFVLSNKFEHEQLRDAAFENIRTKVFPDRKLDDELAKQPEKLKKLIEAKRRLDMEFANIKIES